MKPDIGWYVNARYGLFIHYGLYSLLGRGEWVLNKERIPAAEYEALRGEAGSASRGMDAQSAAHAFVVLGLVVGLAVATRGSGAGGGR